MQISEEPISKNLDASYTYFLRYFVRPLIIHAILFYLSICEFGAFIVLHRCRPTHLKCKIKNFANIFQSHACRQCQ